jgi:hypothetical protein
MPGGGRAANTTAGGKLTIPYGEQHVATAPTSAVSCVAIPPVFRRRFLKVAISGHWPTGNPTTNFRGERSQRRASDAIKSIEKR